MQETMFPNHRGIVPMLAVLVVLAMMELLAVHLFVAAKWPWIGWPLTILSGLSMLWLMRWLRSWRHLPHRLQGGTLTLHMGSLRSLTVPISNIRSISPVISNALIKRPSCRNLVPVAYPNRLLYLSTPINDRRQTDRIAIRLDDPMAFDVAMMDAGVVQLVEQASQPG